QARDRSLVGDGRECSRCRSTYPPDWILDHQRGEPIHAAVLERRMTSERAAGHLAHARHRVAQRLAQPADNLRTRGGTVVEQRSTGSSQTLARGQSHGRAAVLEQALTQGVEPYPVELDPIDGIATQDRIGVEQVDQWITAAALDRAAHPVKTN